MDTTVLLKQHAQTQAARLLVPATVDTMEMALPVLVRIFTAFSGPLIDGFLKKLFFYFVAFIEIIEEQDIFCDSDTYISTFTFCLIVS